MRPPQIAFGTVRWVDGLSFGIALEVPLDLQALAEAMKQSTGEVGAAPSGPSTTVQQVVAPVKGSKAVKGFIRLTRPPLRGDRIGSVAVGPGGLHNRAGCVVSYAKAIRLRYDTLGRSKAHEIHFDAFRQ